MNIRRATSRDLGTLAELRIGMFRDMGVQYEPHLDDLDAAMRPWMETAFAEDRLVGLIAEEDGVVVGGLQVAWLVGPPSRVNPSGRTAYLFGLRVLPEYRRRGIARKLLEQAIELARDNGVRMITLQASEQGRLVYERLGFEPTTEMALLLDERLLPGDAPPGCDGP